MKVFRGEALMQVLAVGKRTMLVFRVEALMQGLLSLVYRLKMNLKKVG